MRMKMKPVTIEELQKIYTIPAIRAEGDGYYLRKVGSSKYQLNPDLQIHVPTMGLPYESGTENEAINLLHGFTSLPKVAEAMSLPSFSQVGFLFCRNYGRNLDGHCYSTDGVCHITLCDPIDSQFILVIILHPTSDTYPKSQGPFFGKSRWSGRSCRHSCRRTSRRYTVSYTYDLIPIGQRYLNDGEQQSAGDIEITKREIIRLANQYLGIESAESSVESTARDDNPADNRPEIPGLVPGIETVRTWNYGDNLIAEESWVIDKLGRLLPPTSITDCRDRFTPATKLAEYRTWDQVPEDAVALSWAKPGIGAKHEFHAILQPEVLTFAQLERIAQLEQQISASYAEQRSPYDGSFSPDIYAGWNFWRH